VAEAGTSLSSRPGWSRERVPGSPGLYRETLSQRGERERKREREKEREREREREREGERERERERGCGGVYFTRMFCRENKLETGESRNEPKNEKPEED
jgi:hypothetical protein